jgi:hypothetical protein
LGLALTDPFYFREFSDSDFTSVTSHSGHAGLMDSVFEMRASYARRERVGAGFLLACTTAELTDARASS